MIAVREPLYKEGAVFTVDVDELIQSEAAAEILKISPAMNASNKDLLRRSTAK